jgi:hypothetical protein
VNAQPVPGADLCSRHLQGHETLANRLAGTNGFAAQFPNARIRCKVEPFVGFGIVPLDALTKRVAHADVVKRFGIVQLSAAKEPGQRRCIVLRDILMSEIHFANGIECVRDPPFRGALKPMHGEAAVFRSPEAVAVHDAKLELSFGLVLLGGASQPAEGGDVVARNLFSPGVDQSKFRLSDGVASIRQGSEHLDGARIIVHGVTDQRIRQLIGGCCLTELGGDHATQNERAEAGCCAPHGSLQGNPGPIISLTSPFLALRPLWARSGKGGLPAGVGADRSMACVGGAQGVTTQIARV